MYVGFDKIARKSVYVREIDGLDGRKHDSDASGFVTLERNGNDLLVG